MHDYRDKSDSKQTRQLILGSHQKRQYNKSGKYRGVGKKREHKLEEKESKANGSELVPILVDTPKVPRAPSPVKTVLEIDLTEVKPPTAIP